jgi:hypothetical protein
LPFEPFLVSIPGPLSLVWQDLRKQRGEWSESESEGDVLEEAERDGAVGRKQERLRPTRERIQRDRNVHRLRLKKLDKLPKDVLLEALQVRRQRPELPKRNRT